MNNPGGGAEHQGHGHKEGGGAPRLKQDRAVRTRAQVLKAAAVAFARKGFSSVTVADVAELCGMTKGAVYFHFTNKEALAVAVTEEFYTRMRSVADGVEQQGLPPLEAVVELITRMAQSFRDDTVVQAGARLQIERHSIKAPLPTPYNQNIELVTDLLTRAKGAGQLREDCRPRVLAQVLVSAFFGAQHISWVLHDRDDLPARVTDILHCVLLRPSA